MWEVRTYYKDLTGARKQKTKRGFAKKSEALEWERNFKLNYEVTTTPKPGLVDRRNSGSHRDMDVFTFIDSAAALYPYFEACARTGRETAEQPAPETFAALRPLGCEAEGEMLDATGGVNTHKGAVFSVGIVCAALGRLDRSLWVDVARVLSEVSAMTVGLSEKDFADVTAENAATVVASRTADCSQVGTEEL